MPGELVVDPDSELYWEGISSGELRYPYCLDCGRAFFFPRTVCPNCLSTNLEWRRSRGLGEVYAYTIVRRAPDAAFASRVPYVVALVELEEGFRVMTNIVACSVDQVRVGMKVSLVFADGVDGRRLPYFRPAEDGERGAMER